LESPAEENRSTLDLRRRKNRSDLPRSFFLAQKILTPRQRRRKDFLQQQQKFFSD
jgi:hypothetical protein